MENSNLIQDYYAPSQSYEYRDIKTGQWFNRSGQELRNPNQYNNNSESFTPFGDE